MLSNSVGVLCVYYWIRNQSNDLYFSGSYKDCYLGNTLSYLWTSQDKYFPNIDTNIFKDSHVRFLDWLSNSISTSYANDTNHIVHINKRVRVVYVVHGVVTCTSGRNLNCVQGTTHKNMIWRFSYLQSKRQWF